jgi:long-chain-acyl-CoA dehydrogenase
MIFFYLINRLEDNPTRSLVGKITYVKNILFYTNVSSVRAISPQLHCIIILIPMFKFVPFLEHYGTDEQIAKYMRPMRDGEIIGAIAMTEPSGGSDLQGIKTTAVQDGDDWILNGSKVFITNGWNADMVLVVAITDKNVS